MARLILDTTIFIDAERRGRQLNRLIADQDDVAMAAVTAAELLVGIELADDARRPTRAAFVRSVWTPFHRGLRRSGRARARESARARPTYRPAAWRP